MTDRPILFSAPMVRAILDGRKTQTRRRVKRPANLDSLEASPNYPGEWVPWVDGDPGESIFCPYGVPGDRLWARETWRMPDSFDSDSPSRAKARVDARLAPNVFYEADGAARTAGRYAGHPGKTRVSIHMPRWASRITLQITDVRVERLNEISEADALAEGVYRVDPDADDLAAGCTPDDFVFMAPGTRQGWGMTKAERAREKWSPTAEHAYSLLWEHINGPGSWTANPWVWAVTFERVAP